MTLADYASTSGISMQLENSIWVNAPIVDYNPNFVSETPYTLDFNGEFFVRSGAFEAKAVPVPVPAYHNQVNAHGEKYTHFAITHTDRVRISPIWGCANICFFCDVPYKSKYIKKNAESLIETIQVALNDSDSRQGMFLFQEVPQSLKITAMRMTCMKKLQLLFPVLTLM